MVKSGKSHWHKLILFVFVELYSKHILFNGRKLAEAKRTHIGI
jgi:hypothetical protein